MFADLSVGPLKGPAINIADVLCKLPTMTLRVHTLIDAVTIKLFRQFACNLRASTPRALVVGVNVVNKNVEPLTYFAAERLRSPTRRTLGREPDHDKAVSHFQIAVHHGAVFVGHPQSYFETKSFNQPINGGGNVIVKKMRSDSRHVVGWVWNHVLLFKVTAIANRELVGLIAK